MDYQLLRTEQLLCTLAGNCAVAADGAQHLIATLIESLKQDGYKLAAIQTPHLRGLSESSSSNEDATFWVINLIPIAVCILCAGFASGLTQGLLSLDHMEMKIKSQSGTEQEKMYSAKVLPIISRHHLLLVTLMLWNASATEALPIFLNKIVPEYVAIIISVTLVLLFGEIIPASILTGPKQLQIAASLTPMVYVVMFLFFPIAYPIALILDYVIGHEEGVTMYSRREIVTMMQIQHEEGQRMSHVARDTMNQDEVTIIGGALTFRDMKVSDVMTLEKDIFMISINETLSYKTVYEIFKAGCSRIPVFDTDHNDIVGIILAKDLIFVDPEDEIPVINFIDLFGRRPIFVWHDDKLGQTLATFRNERAHLALVRDVESQGEGDPYYKVVGLITLEDIIEEILGTEIEDETDTIHGDNNEDTDLEVDRPLRDIDLARLKSLRSKMTDEKLSPHEIEAMVNYLMAGNIPPVLAMIKNDKDRLKQFIEDTGVLTLKRKTGSTAEADSVATEAAAGGEGTPGNNNKKNEKVHAEDFIFRKGKMSTACIIILQGRVTIIKEDANGYTETITKGPWTAIGVEALSCTEGTYILDYSAYIDSEYLRFVRISTFTGITHHHGGHHHHFHEGMPLGGGGVLERKGSSGRLKRRSTTHNLKYKPPPEAPPRSNWLSPGPLSTTKSFFNDNNSSVIQRRATHQTHSHPHNTTQIDKPRLSAAEFAAAAGSGTSSSGYDTTTTGASQKKSSSNNSGDNGVPSGRLRSRSEHSPLLSPPGEATKKRYDGQKELNTPLLSDTDYIAEGREGDDDDEEEKKTEIDEEEEVYRLSNLSENDVAIMRSTSAAHNNNSQSHTGFISSSSAYASSEANTPTTRTVRFSQDGKK